MPEEEKSTMTSPRRSRDRCNPSSWLHCTDIQPTSGRTLSERYRVLLSLVPNKRTLYVIPSTSSPCAQTVHDPFDLTPLLYDLFPQPVQGPNPELTYSSRLVTFYTNLLTQHMCILT
jgi:hypothetical protein